MTRKAKLEKALAFDDTRLQTSNEVVARGKLNPPNANARLAPLHAALIEAVEALEFYSNPNNWADVWCDEFVEREGDVAARIDYEDCERLTDGDGVYFGPAGQTAREDLAKLDKALEGMGGG